MERAVLSAVRWLRGVLLSRDCLLANGTGRFRCSVGAMGQTSSKATRQKRDRQGYISASKRVRNMQRVPECDGKNFHVDQNTCDLCGKTDNRRLLAAASDIQRGSPLDGRALFTCTMQVERPDKNEDF